MPQLTTSPYRIEDAMRYVQTIYIIALMVLVALPFYPPPQAAHSFGFGRGGGVNYLQQTLMTNTTASIAATSTALTLAAPSENITVKTDPSSAVIYIDFAGGTATTADFRLDPGASVTVTGTRMESFNYIGATAQGTVSVCAN